MTHKIDFKLFMTRTEVVEQHAGSHLGHVFDDGPEAHRPALLHELGSAALRARGGARAEGYGEYLALFEDSASATESGSPARPNGRSVPRPG